MKMDKFICRKWKRQVNRIFTNSFDDQRNNFQWKNFMLFQLSCVGDLLIIFIQQQSSSSLRFNEQYENFFLTREITFFLIRKNKRKIISRSFRSTSFQYHKYFHWILIWYQKWCTSCEFYFTKCRLHMTQVKSCMYLLISRFSHFSPHFFFSH